MKIITSAFILLIVSLPYPSSACMPGRMPTSSTEPVTIKIADTYFQIPEGYLTYHFMRVPMEREHIYFTLPVHVLLPNLTDEADRQRRIEIQLLQPHQKGVRSQQIAISKKVIMVYNGQFTAMAGQSPDLVKDYILSISSQNAPETWKIDSRLVKKFNLGNDPCSNSMLSLVRGLINEVWGVRYDTIIEGLYHRNESIRMAAMRQAADSRNKHDASNRLLDILRSKSSENVRSTAAKYLTRMAKDDPQLLFQLNGILQYEKSERVRHTLTSELEKLKPASP